MPGKVNVLVRPQPEFIVTSDGVQGVIGAAMRVAAAVGQGGQFAKHGDIDRAAQSGFELGQRGDFLVLEEREQLCCGKMDGVHNVIITPNDASSSVILTFYGRASKSGLRASHSLFSGIPEHSSHSTLASTSREFVCVAPDIRQLFMHEP